MTNRRTTAVAGAPDPAGAASVRPDGARDFDFLHGTWRVRHLKLRERLVGDRRWHGFQGTLEVGPILAGRGNFDHNGLQDPDGAYVAHSLRVYDPVADLWSIWWLDSRSPTIDPPVTGRFEGRLGTFHADDVYRDQPIRVRTTYESIDKNTAIWTQAFSVDEGKTFEVNWIMDFQRAGE